MRLAVKSFFGGVSGFGLLGGVIAPGAVLVDRLLRKLGCVVLSLALDSEGEWKLPEAPTAVVFAVEPIGDERRSPPVLTSCFRVTEPPLPRSPPPTPLAF